MYKKYTVYDNESTYIGDFVENTDNWQDGLKTIFMGNLTVAPVPSLKIYAVFSDTQCVGHVIEKDVHFYLYNLDTGRYYREMSEFPRWDVTDWRDAIKFDDKDFLDKAVVILNGFLEDTYIVECH